MNRPQPKKGNTVVLITTYGQGKNLDFDCYHQSIFIIDRKRRIIWKEESMEFHTGQVCNYLIKQKARSLPALIKEYEVECARFAPGFAVLDFEVEELGEL